MALGLVFEVFACVISLWGLGVTWAYKEESERVLADIPADLSVAGEYRTTVRVDYPSGHGLKLQLALPWSTPTDIEDCFKTLRATARLARSPWGTVHVPTTLAPHTQFASGPDALGLARLPGSPPGEYEIIVTVAQGAESLRDRYSHLLVRNDVCGCECMPAKIGFVPAGCSAAMGLTLLGIGIARQRRPLLSPP
jgi:hypothetical protein